MTQAILRSHLYEFILVSESNIREAILLYLETTRNLAEGAGAVALAAGRKLREELQGRKVALVLSGGNLSLEQLRWVLHEAQQTERSPAASEGRPGIP